MDFHVSATSGVLGRDRFNDCLCSNADDADERFGDSARESFVKVQVNFVRNSK